MDTNDRLDELQRKYADVFRALEEEGLSLSRVQIQDGKMLIQGAADSVKSKNLVSARIQAVDPHWEEDLVFDIRTEEQQPHMPNTGQTVVNTAEEFTHQPSPPSETS